MGENEVEWTGKAGIKKKLKNSQQQAEFAVLYILTYARLLTETEEGTFIFCIHNAQLQSVTELVDALSPVNHKGLYQG